MKTSREGVDLIREFESAGRLPNRGRPYNDPSGYATVGHGHLLHKSRVTDADRRGRWVPGQLRAGVLTQAEAEELLSRDLAPREAAVRRLVKVPLTQGQFDALVALVFNIGEGHFADSTVLRRLNGSRYREAAEAFMLWTRSNGRVLNGLVRRRRAEMARFRTVEPDPLDGYTRHEVEWVREFDRLRRHGANLSRQAELRRLMLRQRKVIWRAAQPKRKGGDGHGWHHARRDDRYHSLLARTR